MATDTRQDHVRSGDPLEPAGSPAGCDQFVWFVADHAGDGGPAPVWNDYTYDAVTGNRLSVTSHTTTGATATAAYQYPAAGAAHPHKVASISGAASLGAGSYGTDAAGDTTALPGEAVTYDAFGRVSTVTTSAGVQTNIYDASLGSAAGWTQTGRALLNSLPGGSGPFSAVYETFTWTENITW